MSKEVFIGENKIRNFINDHLFSGESESLPVENSFQMSGETVGCIKFLDTGEIYINGELCTDDHAVVEIMRAIAIHFIRIQGVKAIHD